MTTLKFHNTCLRISLLDFQQPRPIRFTCYLEKKFFRPFRGQSRKNPSFTCHNCKIKLCFVGHNCMQRPYITITYVLPSNLQVSYGMIVYTHISYVRIKVHTFVIPIRMVTTITFCSADASLVCHDCMQISCHGCMQIRVCVQYYSK